MDWIKKNPEKFTLLLISLALLGAAVFLVLGEQKFLATFDGLKVKPFESSKVPSLDVGPLKAAQQSAANPSSWAYDSGTDESHSEGVMFSSRLYDWRPLDNVASGTIETAFSGTIYPPVSNFWIISHHFQLADSTVIFQDPDKDGFKNFEESLANTDPNDKNSHPAYTTKLFLLRFVQKSFHLKFNGKPDDHTYEINTIDYNQPTQFLQMGDAIPNTKYKIINYEEKHKKDDSDIDHDVSELTIQSVEDGHKVVLVLGVPADDPDSYAAFRFFLNTPPKDFGVKKDAPFTLDPEPDVTYKLIDIQKDHATIQNQKTNEEITIPLIKGKEVYRTPDGKLWGADAKEVK